MSHLSDATVRYLENAIEVVKQTGHDLQPGHVGMIVRNFESVVMRNSTCSDKATEQDYYDGLVGEFWDSRFESQLGTDHEVTP